MKINTEELITRVSALIELGKNNIALVNDGTDLLHLLEEQLRSEEAGKSGKAAQLRAVKRVLNGAKREKGRTALHYAWMDSQRRQCICDGFKAFRFVEPLPLEPRPSDAGEPIDLSKIFPGNRSRFIECEAPTVADVKAHIAKMRTEQHITGRKAAQYEYDLGDNMPVVNAAYLIDVLEALPGAKLYVEPDASRLIRPMLFVADDGSEAILLPVRTSKVFNAAKPVDPAAEAERRMEDLRRKCSTAKRNRANEIIEHYERMTQDDPDYGLNPDLFVDLVLKLYSNPAA